MKRYNMRRGALYLCGLACVMSLTVSPIIAYAYEESTDGSLWASFVEQATGRNPLEETDMQPVESPELENDQDLDATEETASVEDDVRDPEQEDDSDSPAIVQLTALDHDTKEPVTGAEIVIDADSGTEAYHGTTDASGMIATSDLPPGIYHFRINRSADGYASDDTVHEFTIGEDGSVTGTVEIYCRRVFPITIRSLDSRTMGAIAGAELAVYDKSNRLVASGVTDENGDFKPELSSGTYLFTENSVPPKYVQSHQGYIFTVKENGSTVGALSVYHLTKPAANVSSSTTPKTSTTVDAVPKTGNTPWNALLKGALAFLIAAQVILGLWMKRISRKASAGC